MFRGSFAMNDPCPVCGLVFEREPGYFLGALYASYALSVSIIVPVYFLLQWLLSGWPGPLVLLVTMLLYLPLIPVVFRLSRVVWIYFDRAAAPSESSSHSGWMRWREARKADKDAKKP